jgi:multiple antibiotic resistance protein
MMVANIVYLYTIFFITLGPLKLIPIFATATRGTSLAFQRAVAMRAVLVASALLLLLALAGVSLLSRLGVSLQALQLGGGLVLLLFALSAILHPPPPLPTPDAPHLETKESTMRLAVTPLAVPAIVPPVGIAAVLTAFVFVVSEQPSFHAAIFVALAVMMVLDFLAMLVAHTVLEVPLVGAVLLLLGAVLSFLQVALAIQIMLRALHGLGLLPAYPG